jgi:hypothetical protein
MECPQPLETSFLTADQPLRSTFGLLEQHADALGLDPYDQPTRRLRSSLILPTHNIY